MLSQPGFGQLRRSLPKWLWAIAALLVVSHVVFMIVHYRITEIPCGLRELFDLEENESLGGFFTTLILMFAGLLVLYHARQSHEENRAIRILWLMLGIGFFFLSIVNIVGLHRIMSALPDVSWTVLATPVAVLVGTAYIPFLLRLPASTRNRFIAAGAIYLAGSIGIDFATEWFPDGAAYDQCMDRIATLGYGLTTAIENALEMSGVILFINTMLKIEA